MLDSLRQDTRYALRSLVKRPGFTFVALITLAIGIGATTAIFSVVHGVLLRPLPYQDAKRLVHLTPAGGHPTGALLVFRERARTLEEIAGYGMPIEISLTGRGTPERLTGVRISDNLLSMLGARAAIGRVLVSGENAPGQGDVVVLSHRLWERRFGGDRGILGQALLLDGEPRTVVGVMPAGFQFPSRGVDFWIPVTVNTANPIALWSTGALDLIGRRRADVSVEQVSRETASLMPHVRDAFPWRMPDGYGGEAHALSLHEATVGDVRLTLTVLLAATAFVLLIACANVANLQLARAAAREREMAIRTALGAGRWRLARQLLAESVLLALAGGVLGVLIAWWGVAALVSVIPAELPRAGEIAVDGRVLLFAFFSSLLAGALLGALPALRASRSVQPALGEGARGSTVGRGRHRLTGALVAAEIAVAVVLVAGAGLLVRSLQELMSVDPGFNTERVVAARVAPPVFKYEDAAAQRGFHDELLRRVRAAHGVTTAALTSAAPLAEPAWGLPLAIEGYFVADGEAPPYARRRQVSAGYVETLSIPLIAGRAFTDADRADAPQVVIINETLAGRHWPDGDAVGKRIRPSFMQGWWTIVGVVGDTPNESLAEAADIEIYRPLAQEPTLVTTLLARTHGDVRVVTGALRRIVASTDEDAVISDIRPMSAVVSGSVAAQRFTTLLLAGFALTAVLLGAVGIYGVMSQAVSQRTQEFGIRMALGARAEDVLRVVLRRGLMLAGAGVVLGLLGAFGATRVLRSLLYGVSPVDPVTFALVPLLLGIVALLASYLPARRATRVDPTIALRAE